MRREQDSSTRADRGETDLSPSAVPADHVGVCHGNEERVRLQVLGQAGEELSDVDEVHLEKHVLKQTQDTQTRPEQTLLPVSAEDVPHSARHVQWEGLTVEGEDPAWRHTDGIIITTNYY